MEIMNEQRLDGQVGREPHQSCHHPSPAEPQDHLPLPFLLLEIRVPSYRSISLHYCRPTAHTQRTFNIQNNTAAVSELRPYTVAHRVLA
jgi:hypothetical protein